MFSIKKSTVSSYAEQVEYLLKKAHEADAILPKELQERGMAIHENIALVLCNAVGLLERR